MPEQKHIGKQSRRIQKNKPLLFSRRNFIGGLLAGTVLASGNLKAVNISSGDILTDDQFQLIRSVQQILLPSDGNGPGAKDIIADTYLLWVLSDIRMDPEEKEYIINGIGWVDETAEEEFSMGYNKLSQEKKEELIEIISREKWGRSWLGVILNFIFEALLSDPQYGGNPDNIGWNWLGYNGGSPRPTIPNLYPEILVTIRSNYPDGK
jgi:gluconate 2-dehydrogenase gamma chain